jgi:hypothetical protein
MVQEPVSRREGEDRAEEHVGVEVLGPRASEVIVALYPGKSRGILLKVYGPRGRVVAVVEQGFPYSVAHLEIAPRQARAPFNADIVVSAKHDAAPGVYPWNLRVVDVTKNRVLGGKPITLVILPKNLPRTAAKHVARLRRVYEKHGIQIALWAALKTLYPEGASFSTLWALYQLLTGRSVSKGTVGNTLTVMVKKAMVERLGNGLYRAIDLNPRIVLSRVDLKRVRFPRQVLGRNSGKHSEETHGTLEEYRFSLDELPQPIRRAYTYAQRIARLHNPLTALYFILYSLMGVRQTGYFLLWLSGWFLVYEPKTGFCHHFYSWLLHHMLKSLGLEEGIYYNPSNQQHLKAQRLAQEYIKEYYGSHQNARRLHYMLWEQGYVWSDNEIYTVKVYHYPLTHDIGLQILNKTGREELHSENIRNEPARVEVLTALPYRHIDRRNEETYHYRPSGLY